MRLPARFVLIGPGVRADAARAVESLPITREKPVEVMIRHYRKRRSLAQNACFHALMAELARGYAEQTGTWHRPAVWKELVKQQLLGSTAVEIEGQTVEVTRGTSDLDTKEFAQLLSILPGWAHDNLGVGVTLPDEWDEAVGDDG